MQGGFFGLESQPFWRGVGALAGGLGTPPAETTTFAQGAFKSIIPRIFAEFAEGESVFYAFYDNVLSVTHVSSQVIFATLPRSGLKLTMPTCVGIVDATVKE